MHPENGVRVVLDLEEEGTKDVTYRVALFDPTSVWRAAATITRANGKVTFTGWDPDDPPTPVVRLARAFLRTVWGSTRKVPPPPWPRRVARWRPEA